MSTINWTQGHTHRSAHWHSENGAPLPKRTVLADDRTKADDAYRQACEGTALLWQGDFHNARQLLQAMGRRIDRKPSRPSTSPSDSFHQHRRSSSHRARVLGKLLVVLDGDYNLALRRAPDLRQACQEAYGPATEPMAVSLRELLGVIGAHQWRLKGVDVPALSARVHPHYGVFAPVRGEYVDLVARAPLPAVARQLPASSTAFDLGTGTGVLAAVLARRGINRVVATDISPRALACARENVHRLGLTDRIEVSGPGLFPEGPERRADLVVCNPPWLPARPTGPIEQGVHDPDSTMLHGFLAGLSAHLRPGGEGWLILSDLAEHLGLRTRRHLLDAVGAAGLRVVGRIDTKPRHPRAKDADDPLHTARSAETTSLWRLVAME
ncbi:class I SAM-dependent methyltransferase [Streptomyces pseudovenezuelae]|uniref:Methylase of polypeptide subunit release factors n=1 Tax=Streptomyces pseudovenezuelae TaxID=67350 RepID=A0ABT6LWL1_9ACTN|nr:class I SAM-dependent methyltransferase [Streptomyces pseudovenezuelae]MDH6220695.1 methylase of polypeptide subunit release factors [Streptomyces pseudovenezuelae]